MALGVLVLSAAVLANRWDSTQPRLVLLGKRRPGHHLKQVRPTPPVSSLTTAVPPHSTPKVSSLTTGRESR